MDAALQGAPNTERISFREQLCYGLGDASFNIFMGITMMLLTIFYTDVFKLDPAVMGTLFLVTRIIDAISDPLCGMLSDRTVSKHGRYRVWLLWFSVPYGLSCAAVFLCPELSDTGRTIYAYVTYIFLVLSFTCVVVPYVSLLGAISSDSNERLSINAIRFPLTKVAYIVCSLIVPSLLALFDNEVIGYRVVMSGIGILCIVLVWLCFANTKERVYAPVDTSVTLMQQLRLLFTNDQALCMYGAQIFVMINNTLKFGAAAYIVKYMLQSDNIVLSAILTAASVAGIIAPFVANFMLSRGLIKRRTLLVMSQLIAAVLLILIGVCGDLSNGGETLPTQSAETSTIIMIVGLFFLSTFSSELTAILGWAAVADCADYTYAKKGIRITGIISGGMLFSTKLGMAIGGAILGYVLSAYNYVPSETAQASSDQLFAFVLLFAYLPGIFLILACICFAFFKLEADYCCELVKEGQRRDSLKQAAN